MSSSFIERKRHQTRDGSERKAARRAAALRDRREAEYLAIRQARLRDHNLEWLDQHS
ncbi:hypothetical protein [Kocuria palustris]|uniref:hypothetical protein n=1 Tax=Kocuria palustris TaxID=71999 RepID=UPI003332DD3A